MVRTNPQYWSDEFDIVDQPDVTVFIEDDPGDPCLDEGHIDFRERRLTPWEQLEHRLGERMLGADLDEGDCRDEYPTAH